MFETEINSIKSIINELRSQLRCELSKERKTKNGQFTDVINTRILVHYGHLDFLLPVMRAAENKDDLKLNAENMGQEKIEAKILQAVKREHTVERKKDLESNSLTQLQLIRMRKRQDFWNEVLCFCPIC